jgi:hypothetical protein
MDDAAPLDTSVDVLDGHTTAGEAAIGGFLCACQGPARGLSIRAAELDVVEYERPEGLLLVRPPPASSTVGRLFLEPRKYLSGYVCWYS